MPAKVSVIIATYNRAHLLKTAIDSVLSQTYNDYEIIVADDGSSDGTRALVSRYGDRVRYFYQENLGKSVALNNAISRASGEWLALLDSDDYWLPEKLEWQFRAIDRFEDCGACFTDGQFVNNPHMDTTLFRFYGQKYGDVLGALPDPVRTFAESSSGASVVTLLCRTELVRKIGGFDPRLRFTEDYDFIFRLALVTGYCFVNLPLAIIDRSQAAARHAGTCAVWDNVDFRLQCEQYRYEKWLSLAAESSSDIRRIILKHLRAVHSGWANWYLASGQYQLALRELATAAKYNLTLGLLLKWLLAYVSPTFARGVVARREGFNANVF